MFAKCKTKSASFEYLICAINQNSEDMANFIGYDLTTQETWNGVLLQTRSLFYKDEEIKDGDVVVKLQHNTFKIFTWEEFVILFEKEK